MRALIVGHGYVGSRVAFLWREQGAEITVTTTSPEKVPTLQELYPHVTLAQNLKRAAQNQDVILVAVAPHPGASYEETYLATANTLASAVKDGHVIYLSSVSVYGDQGGRTVTEETPPDPISPQAEILLRAEEAVLQIPGACVLRLGQIVGPGRTLESKAGKTLPGTGENFANLSPIELIVQGIEAARKNRLAGIFNLCAKEHPRRRELYPDAFWDPAKKSHHGGNKKVESNKIWAYLE